MSPAVLEPGLQAAIDLLNREAKNCRDAASHEIEEPNKSYWEHVGLSYKKAADYLAEQKENLTKPKPPEVDPRQIPLFNGQ